MSNSFVFNYYTARGVFSNLFKFCISGSLNQNYLLNRILEKFFGSFTFHAKQYFQCVVITNIHVPHITGVSFVTQKKKVF